MAGLHGSDYANSSRLFPIVQIQLLHVSKFNIVTLFLHIHPDEVNLICLIELFISFKAIQLTNHTDPYVTFPQHFAIFGGPRFVMFKCGPM